MRFCVVILLFGFFSRYLLGFCHKTKSDFFPFLFIPGLLFMVRGDCENPLLKWPLFDVTCTSELTSGQVSTGSCPQTFRPDDMVDNQVPMYFSGRSDSHVNLKIRLGDDAIGNIDSGFAFYVRTEEENGCLFHYKSNSDLRGVPGFIVEIKLCLADSRFVVTEVLSSEAEKIVNTGKTLQENSWHMVALIKDYSTNKYKLHIDNIQSDVTVNERFQELAVPGILRVGGSFDVDTMFTGNIMCGAMYKGWHERYSSTDCIAECKDLADVTTGTIGKKE